MLAVLFGTPVWATTKLLNYWPDRGPREQRNLCLGAGFPSGGLNLQAA